MDSEIYDLGLRLKKLRDDMGLTQKALAEKLSVKVLTIKRYESNEQHPPIEKLEKMALLFRVSIDYLMNLDKRQAVYIDDLPLSKQAMILEIIDSIRNEHSNNKTGD